MKVVRPAGERFAEKVSPEPNSGCWLWLGADDGRGYGFFTVNKKQTRAHRWAWMLLRGPIPDGMDILHRCDNPACVNPDHLSVGTHAQNMADMVAKGRNPRSKIGHPQTEETRRKLSVAHTGKVISEEAKRKVGDALRGRKYPDRKRPEPATEEHRRNLSLALSGKKKSDATRARMVEAWKVRKAKKNAA